jgi:porin
MNLLSHLRPALAGVAILRSLLPISAQAQQAFLQDAHSAVESGIKTLSDRGAQFQFDYTGEGFANLSGGYKRGGDYDGLLKISLQLDLQKILQWNGATLYASMLYPHGNGITAQYVHDYNILSGIDAYDSVRLFEFWLQQTFFAGRFSIRVGELTTDNDFLVSPNGALFINSIFGPLGTAFHNVDLPTYPLTSQGIRLHYSWDPSFYIQAVALDDNPGSQTSNNTHGTHFGYFPGHGILTVVEAGYVPASGSSGFAPDYKFGAYYDSQFHPDISKPTSSHGDYAFYAVADQPLCVAPGSTADSPRGLSGFIRASYAPDQRNPVIFEADTGFNYLGLLPGRPKDIFGLGFSFERLGMDIQPPSGPVLSHHEHVVELTYLANLNDWFSLQPDLQYIINPGGIGRLPNAFVAGLRFNVLF